MKSSRIVLAAFAFSFMAATLTASVSEVQIYGIVERVVLEPNEKAPERIKIWGVFALLHTNQEPVRSSDGPYAPHRGYLHFKLPPVRKGDTKKLAHETARKEWADLKAIAGTGQAITFGSWTSNYLGLARNSRSQNGFVGGPTQEDALRVYDERERSGPAIPYTMDTGIARIPDQGKYAVLITQLKNKLQR